MSELLESLRTGYAGLRLAATARFWHVSPARAYLGIEDPALALEIDEILALRLVEKAESEFAPDPETGVSVAPDSAYDDD